MSIMKQYEVHVNRFVACPSGNDFIEMALNSAEIASEAWCSQLVYLKTTLRMVVLTIPVHNIKAVFLEECLRWVDLDLQSAGVIFDVMNFENALVNSQMVRKLGVKITEVTNMYGTAETDFYCAFELHGRHVWWLLCSVHALTNIKNNFIGPVKIMMNPFSMAGIGTIDPGMLEFLLMWDTQSNSGLRVVHGLLRKVVNSTFTER